MAATTNSQTQITVLFYEMKLQLTLCMREKFLNAQFNISYTIFFKGISDYKQVFNTYSQPGASGILGSVKRQNNAEASVQGCVRVIALSISSLKRSLQLLFIS